MNYYTRAEERLAKVLMEDFQRRGSHFLQVGLHAPLLPEFFWDLGFDVTATDENKNAIDEASLRSGPRISYQMAKLDYLPFDDNSFDYSFFSCYAELSFIDARKNDVLYKTSLALSDKNFKKNFFAEKGIFAELCRVSRNGVIILAKNPFAYCKYPAFGASINPFSLYKVAKTYCTRGAVRFASTGFLPSFVPKKFSFINNSISFLPFGALVGVCLHFNYPPVSGIGALLQKEKANLEQAPIIQRIKN